MRCAGERRDRMVIMNFTGVYEWETFYRDMDYIWLDVKGVQGTNCYCDEEAQDRLVEIIREFGAGGLHFLDSGNYHYVSKLWTDMVEEDFELLVFDHHTDMQEPMLGDLLSCGGWLKAALDTNARLKRVWLAGPDEGAAERDVQGYGGRVVCVGERDMESVDGWRERLGIKGLPLYVSVDKDVLSREEAVTNWDQGTVRLSSVLDIIRAAAKGRRIIGMDVCGENPEEGRGQGKPSGGDSNDRTNKALAEIYLDLAAGGPENVRR